MKKRNLPSPVPKIIDHSDQIHPSLRSLLFMLSLACWITWFYLVSPLVILIGALLKYPEFSRYAPDDMSAKFHLLLEYGVIIGSLACLLIVWSAYNWIRFHKHHRRLVPKNTTSFDLAQDFRISERMAERAIDAKVAIYHFDEYGQIVGLVRFPSEVSPAPVLLATA